MVEGFKLIEDGNVMEILVSVDDPVAYTTTLWSAIQRFRRRQASPDAGAHLGREQPVPKPCADKPDF